MNKTILIYSLAIALAAFVLEWIEYRYAVRAFSSEMYVLLIAVAFTALGIWVGSNLTARRVETDFDRNDKAIEHLGISGRELEVLDLLSDGLSNKEISARLFVSENTVKTHVASLYSKLEASRRTQAVQKARSLRIIA